jgi:hypothetical protein
MGNKVTLDHLVYTSLIRDYDVQAWSNGIKTKWFPEIIRHCIYRHNHALNMNNPDHWNSFPEIFRFFSIEDEDKKIYFITCTGLGNSDQSGRMATLTHMICLQDELFDKYNLSPFALLDKIEWIKFYDGEPKAILPPLEISLMDSEEIDISTNLLNKQSERDVKIFLHQFIDNIDKDKPIFIFPEAKSFELCKHSLKLLLNLMPGCAHKDKFSFSINEFYTPSSDYRIVIFDPLSFPNNASNVDADIIHFPLSATSIKPHIEDLPVISYIISQLEKENIDELIKLKKDTNIFPDYGFSKIKFQTLFSLALHVVRPFDKKESQNILESYYAWADASKLFPDDIVKSNEEKHISQQNTLLNFLEEWLMVDIERTLPQLDFKLVLRIWAQWSRLLEGKYNVKFKEFIIEVMRFAVTKWFPNISEFIDELIKLNEETRKELLEKMEQQKRGLWLAASRKEVSNNELIIFFKQIEKLADSFKSFNILSTELLTDISKLMQSMIEKSISFSGSVTSEAAYAFTNALDYTLSKTFYIEKGRNIYLSVLEWLLSNQNYKEIVFSSILNINYDIWSEKQENLIKYIFNNFSTQDFDNLFEKLYDSINFQFEQKHTSSFKKLAPFIGVIVNKFNNYNIEQFIIKFIFNRNKEIIFDKHHHWVSLLHNELQYTSCINNVLKIVRSVMDTVDREGFRKVENIDVSDLESSFINIDKSLRNEFLICLWRIHNSVNESFHNDTKTKIMIYIYWKMCLRYFKQHNEIPVIEFAYIVFAANDNSERKDLLNLLKENEFELLTEELNELYTRIDDLLNEYSEDNYSKEFTTLMKIFNDVFKFEPDRIKDLSAGTYFRKKIKKKGGLFG